jgi:hypothetical protein
MDFSTDFAERLKEAYPAFFPLYSSLTESERGFIKLILEKDAAKSDINKRLEDMPYEIEYDPETSILTVWELDAHADVDPDGLVSGGFFRNEDKRLEMTVEEFKDEIVGSSSWPWHGSLFDSLDEYIENEKQLSKAKPSFTEERINELQELSSKYDTLDYLHRIMASKQKGLEDILDDIIQGKDFDDISRLTYYIELYNKLPVARVSSRGGVLTEHPLPPIEEKDYLEGRMSYWTTRVDQDLAYCLVGFLLPVGNRKYIAKCLNCEKYFVAAKYTPTNPQKFCKYNGDKCRFDWNNKRRIESGKAAKYMKDGRLEGKYQ